MKKMRRIDYVSVFVCALAAAFCAASSIWSAPLFVISSSIGLTDSIKNKVLTGSLINGIFLALNLYFIIQRLKGVN